MASVNQQVLAALGATAGGAGIPPSSLTGLIGWWDASVFASMTLSGSNITAMADQSGAGHNLSAGTSNVVYSPTGFNGLPGMSFDHSTLQNTSFAMGTDNKLTAFLVGQFANAGDSYGRLISYTAPGGGNNDANNNGSWLLSREGTGTNAVLYRNGSQAARSCGYNTPRRLIATIDSSGVMKIYVDGVATTGSTLNAAFVSAGRLVLGNLDPSSSASFSVALMGEVGVATGFTDATGVAALDAYLQSKWGL